jgi:hypothetical protein
MDSGASHGLMLDPQSDSRITIPTRVLSSVIGRGLGGEIMGKIGRVKTLYMGTHELNDAIVSLPDANSYYDSLKMGTVDLNGTIGGETLSRFTVIFNFPKEEIYLKKNNAFKKGFHYNLSGLNVKAKGAKLNVFEITEVRDQSAAHRAGITEGDLIMSINGIPSTQINLNVINAFFNLRPGKKIFLTLDRKGQKIRRDFRLEDQI